MEDKLFLSIFMFSIMFPFSIFLFKRSLLNKKKSWVRLFFITLFLAIGGIFSLVFMQDKKNMPIVIMLIVPFCSICFYRIIYSGFKKIFKREPVDTFLNFKNNLVWDRAFNIIFLTAILSLSGLILVIFGMPHE